MSGEEEGYPVAKQRDRGEGRAHKAEAVNLGDRGLGQFVVERKGRGAEA